MAQAVWIRLNPNSGIKIEATWFIEMLNSLSWSDRNRALAALQILTDTWDPAVLDQLRERALPALADMARWKTLAHALPAYILLGRVAGVSEERIQESWSSGNREPLIVEALKQPAKLIPREEQDPGRPAVRFRAATVREWSSPNIPESTKLSLRPLALPRRTIAGFHRESAVGFFHRQERDSLDANQSARRGRKRQRRGANIVGALAQDVQRRRRRARNRCLRACRPKSRAPL